MVQLAYPDAANVSEEFLIGWCADQCVSEEGAMRDPEWMSGAECAARRAELRSSLDLPTALERLSVRRLIQVARLEDSVVSDGVEQGEARIALLR